MMFSGSKSKHCDIDPMGYQCRQCEKVFNRKSHLSDRDGLWETIGLTVQS